MKKIKEKCPFCELRLTLDDKKVYTVKTNDETTTLQLAECPCCKAEIVVSDSKKVIPGLYQSYGETESEKIPRKRDWPVKCDCRCGKTTVVTVVSDDNNWYEQGRTAIQKCFPYLTTPEREAIKSGMCWDCQRKMFPADHDENGNYVGSH